MRESRRAGGRFEIFAPLAAAHAIFGCAATAASASVADVKRAAVTTTPESVPAR
jgi:hypothetical protein